MITLLTVIHHSFMNYLYMSSENTLQRSSIVTRVFQKGHFVKKKKLTPPHNSGGSREIRSRRGEWTSKSKWLLKAREVWKIGNVFLPFAGPLDDLGDLETALKYSHCIYLSSMIAVNHILILWKDLICTFKTFLYANLSLHR